MNEDGSRCDAARSHQRGFLTYLAFAMAVLMAGSAAFVLLKTMSPAAPWPPDRWATKVDLGSLEPGEPLSIVYEGRLIFALKLTDEQLRDAQSVAVADLTDPNARNTNLSDGAQATVANRTFEAEGTFLVVEGICGPFGSVAMYGEGDFDAWFCPVRGAHFDILGRVHRGPDGRNMRIPLV